MKDINRVTCEEAFRKLDDYIDRELSDTETQEVEAHLAVCENCAAEYRFEASLIAGLRDKLSHIRLPEGSMSRILETIADEPAPDGDGERGGLKQD